MGTYTIPDVLHHLSVLLTSLMFNIALCVIVVTQGTKDDRGNRSFRDVVFVVPIANIITCVAYVVNSAYISHMPVMIPFFFRNLLYLANLSVTFFFARYIESYFGGKNGASRFFKIFNNICLLASSLLVIAYFVISVPNVRGAMSSAMIPSGIRVFSGYIMELYFLSYALIFFLRRRMILPSRVQMTVVWSFIVTMFTIVLEYITPREFLVNYLGASIGLYLFYFGVETPDYRNLQLAMQELEEQRLAADEARKHADEANRSKSEFLANMSHEIRTPINAVLGMNEMILRESRDERITGYAHNVDSAGKTLLSIINDILDFSKIEAGKIEIIPANYQLSTVINDVTNMIAFKARKKGLIFDISIDDKLPDNLCGDEVRIRQIMVNILNNAVKYTEHGKIQLSIKGAEYAANNDKMTLVITVSDTGMGIRRADLDRLFRKFERIDMEHNKTIEGTGLGLAITQNLVSLMGGTINVESIYGEGSTFTMRVPQQVVSREPVGDYHERFNERFKESSRYRESFRAPNARLLVVDDTELNLQVVETMLKRTLMKVDTALSGSDALILTMSNHYDMILMDQRMPEMDGTQTLFRIRQQTGGLNRATPVICLTADAVVGAKDRYIEKGFTDYMTKPIEGATLEKLLCTYLPPDKLEKIQAPQEEEGRNGERSTMLLDIYTDYDGFSYADALHYQNNEAQLVQILRTFYTTIDDKSHQIETLLEDGDYDTFTIMVHALKSSARILGMNDLSEEARLMEERGDKYLDGDKDIEKLIKQDTPKLLADYRRIKEIFAPVFPDENAEEASNGDENKELISEQALNELLSALREFASILDYDDMNELVKQAHQYRLPDAEKARFRELESAIRLVDTDKIMTLLK